MFDGHGLQALRHQHYLRRLRIDGDGVSWLSGWELETANKDEIDTAQVTPCSHRLKHPSDTLVLLYLATQPRIWLDLSFSDLAHSLPKERRLDLIARLGTCYTVLLHFLEVCPGQGKGRLSDYQLPDFPLICVTWPPVVE
jgi:hypothetical protein